MTHEEYYEYRKFLGVNGYTNGACKTLCNLLKLTFWTEVKTGQKYADVIDLLLKFEWDL